MFTQELETTVAELIAPGKGILAADESAGTIEKRFKVANVPSSERTRRDYREMLFSTPGLGAFISGVILYEETLKQNSAAGLPLPRLLAEQGMIPGIKVDKGTVALPGFPREKITQGLDGLAERLVEYKQYGARFAKWRAVIALDAAIPSAQAVAANAEVLARYAAVCQEQGLVPIVEPEVLMDGDHTIETCARVSEAVLHEVFDALFRHRVTLEHMLLKPNMVVPGMRCPTQASPAQVAAATLHCLWRTVPAAVPGIHFLSGGQSEAAATANLNAINSVPDKKPWQLGFSFARALQGSALRAWGGDPANIPAAQQVLSKRARLNGAARRGDYSAAMEKE